MNWLKNKIRDWLGINQLQKSYDLLHTSYTELKEIHEILSETHNVLLDNYKQLNNGVDVLVNQNEIIERRNTELSNRIEFILKNFRIAVDHDPMTNKSWAVICVDGKPEYVKFVSLTNRETREVMEYLSRFDRGSRIWDSPAPHLKLWDFK